MKFLAELKRRNVIRMAGLYLVGAWLIVQVAGTILPMFGAPDWVARTVVILLAIGFIPALVISWVFELTPEGLKRDSKVPEAQSIAPQTAQKMNRLIVALLVLAVVYFGVDKFVLAPKREAALVSTAVQASNAAKAPQSDKSIAVMPFVNMSSDKEQEYFSDGMTEEVLNALANVPNLAVTARTSVFSLKGQNKDVREIGKLLGGLCAGRFGAQGRQ
jgi:adenylate cyclase